MPGFYFKCIVSLKKERPLLDRFGLFSFVRKFKKSVRDIDFLVHTGKQPMVYNMSKKEFSRFQSAIREYFIESGSYSRIFMNYSYADILKDELKCSDAQLTALLDIKDLAIVDGLNEDFVIVP